VDLVLSQYEAQLYVIWGASQNTVLVKHPLAGERVFSHLASHRCWEALEEFDFDEEEACARGHVIDGGSL
jgi:hypothetical protein